MNESCHAWASPASYKCVLSHKDKIRTNRGRTLIHTCFRTYLYVSHHYSHYNTHYNTRYNTRHNTDTISGSSLNLQQLQQVTAPNGFQNHPHATNSMALPTRAKRWHARPESDMDAPPLSSHMSNPDLKCELGGGAGSEGGGGGGNFLYAQCIPAMDGGGSSGNLLVQQQLQHFKSGDASFAPLKSKPQSSNPAPGVHTDAYMYMCIRVFICVFFVIVCHLQTLCVLCMHMYIYTHLLYIYVCTY